MEIIYQLEDFKPTSEPISLTIGNFDGVHLGHQAILSQLTGRKVVFTFSNHPIEILKDKPFYRLTTTSHRLQLLKNNAVDTSIIVPFTKAFSEQSAEDFLLNLAARVPFSHLILGHDAVIGRARQGDAAHLRVLAGRYGFSLDYLKPLMQNGRAVSSSEIRKHIQKGCFEKASMLLGRPYSIMTTVEPGTQQGGLLGFHTANLKVHTLCLPPLGVYVVRTTIQGKSYLGVANLGRAPTLHANRPPILEIHLIGYKGALYQQEIEAVFLKFLRHERRFDSIEALKSQIQNDIQSALFHCEEATY